MITHTIQAAYTATSQKAFYKPLHLLLLQKAKGPHFRITGVNTGNELHQAGLSRYAGSMLLRRPHFLFWASYLIVRFS